MSPDVKTGWQVSHGINRGLLFCWTGIGANPTLGRCEPLTASQLAGDGSNARVSGIGAKPCLDAATHVNDTDGLALEILKLIVRQEYIGEVMVVR